jgi:Kef-type K+ transport system membrane component KefB
MVAALLLFPHASASAIQTGSKPHHWGTVFLMFAIILMAGKIGNIVEKFGQPAVIGELAAGIFLAGLGYIGWGLMDDIAASETIGFLAGLGALLLLFSIGLESNLSGMRRVGVNALFVAIIGVAVPFSLGTLVLGPLFFSADSLNAHLFLGAALVATSVGITASVFKSLGITKSRAAQTVLGAAVIDDVLGLIVLAVVSALALGGDVSVTMISGLVLKSFGFLSGALVIGTFAAKPISRFFSSISAGIGMKLSVVLGLALVFGYLAELSGLEPIIGAFAAGLVLESVHFTYFADPSFVRDLHAIRCVDPVDHERLQAVIIRHRHSHVEDLIGNLNLIFVPIFFTYTGMQVDIASFLQPGLYVVALVISLVAIAGKLVAGFAAKGHAREKLLVGFAMVPRGEVGLIFAATGKSIGVLSTDMFSVIILVVIITTFVSPPIISRFAVPA